METKEDISYGVVPLIKEGGQWLVFLIHQYGHGGDVYWTFPKGHPEAGESHQESALRELKEETNLSLHELKTDKEYTQGYSFQSGMTMINKKVVYFLGTATSKEFTIQEDEVQDAGWFTFEEAQEKLTHDNAKLMLATIEADVLKAQ